MSKGCGTRGCGTRGPGEPGIDRDNTDSASHMPEVKKGKNKGSKPGSKGKGHKNAGNAIPKKVKQSVVKG